MKLNLQKFLNTRTFCMEEFCKLGEKETDFMHYEHIFLLFRAIGLDDSRYARARDSHSSRPLLVVYKEI